MAGLRDDIMGTFPSIAGTVAGLRDDIMGTFPSIAGTVAGLRDDIMGTFPSIAGTVAGLRDDIKQAIEALIKATPNTVSVSSGCELFLRFITLTSLDHHIVCLNYILSLCLPLFSTPTPPPSPLKRQMQTGDAMGLIQI